MSDELDRAKRRKIHPGESQDYRAARTRLLAEEIALQRKIDAVAAMRRQLPPGPVVEDDYRFKDGNGKEVGLADLFGRHEALMIYFWMYGPERERPCPMCTNLLGPLDANARDLTQRVALSIAGRSRVERQKAFAQERGWRSLKFVQCLGDSFPLDFGGLDLENGYEYPVLCVFTRDTQGVVRLFWKGAMTGEMAEAGKDPRGGPDFAPLWTALDLTPEGRGDSWYPKLEYD